MLRTGILHGVDPRSNEYWGAIGDYDQRIVEAADIARILWLTGLGSGTSSVGSSSR